MVNKGVVWTIGQQIVVYSLSLVFTGVLSRIVLPEQFGLFNMVSTLTAFFMVFSDGGLASAIIQRKKISDQAVANLFWVNALVGVFMAFVCVIFAPYLSDFYGYKELSDLTSVMGVNFIFTGLTITVATWLKRHFLLRELAVINIISVISAGIIALYAAHEGAGYWALAIQTIVKSSFTLIGTIIVGKFPFHWYCKKTSIRSMLNFSAGLLGFGVVNYFARNLDNILIAKSLGTEELALYVKAYFLMSLPSMIISAPLKNLMIPLLSKSQDNIENFHLLYKKSLRLICLLTFPISGYLLIFPQDIVLLFYGAFWVESVPLVKILSIACITQPLYNTMGWLFTALGKSKEFFYYGIFSSIILSAGFVYALQWGSIGVAWSYSIVMGVFLTVLSLAYSHYIAKISFIKTIYFISPLIIIFSLSLSLSWWLSLNYISTMDLGLISNIIIRSGFIITTSYLLLILFYRNNINNILTISD